MIEFAGTLKISAIEIAEKETLALAKHITDCEGLVELKAHHCTLVHQKYLKELQKKRKKALKGGESDPVRFPHKNLNISTRGATVHVVHDVHPSTGLPRKSVRLTLNESTQETLSGWVSAFCIMNNIERDEMELSRQFHITYANITGLPGDSVR